MATQGIVSIMAADGVTVLFKAVAGSDGYNAPKLVEWVKTQTEALTTESIYAAALRVNFGSKSSLVVQDCCGALCCDEEIDPGERGNLYRDTAKFRDPRFNPRWECGIADYVEVVSLMPVDCSAAHHGRLIVKG